eukprot:scaffold159408_cov34-Tisochrysis_lutea.AAC.4
MVHLLLKQRNNSVNGAAGEWQLKMWLLYLIQEESVEFSAQLFEEDARTRWRPEGYPLIDSYGLFSMGYNYFSAE